jgi:hypothetical protein
METYFKMLLEAMARPGMRYVLLKFEPGLFPVKLLAEAIGPGGRMFCFYQPVDEAAESFQRLEQMHRLLSSNPTRRKLGAAASIYIDADHDDLSPSPNMDSRAYTTWVSNVWSSPIGIRQAYVSLRKKAREVQELVTALRGARTGRGAVPSVVQLVPCQWYAPLAGTPNTKAAVEALELLNAQTAKNKQGVLNLLSNFATCTGLVDTAAALTRSPVAIADELAQTISSLEQQRCLACTDDELKTCITSLRSAGTAACCHR